LKLKQGVVLGLLLSVFFMSAFCGKKGPPFLPEKEIPFRVEQLKAVCDRDVFYLKGTVFGPQGPVGDFSNITGCRIYHACYDLDNPPCEGCPIDYGPFKEIKGEIVAQGNFSCRVPIKKTKGIHFFKVCLMGPRGETGPFSDRAKLVIEN